MVTMGFTTMSIMLRSLDECCCIFLFTCSLCYLKRSIPLRVTTPQRFEDFGLTLYATILLSEEHLKRKQKLKQHEKVNRNKRRQQCGYELRCES